MFTVFQPEQPLFRNGKTPLSAIFLLAQGNLRNNFTGFEAQSFIASALYQSRGRAEPMPGELAPQIRQRAISTFVNALQTLIAPVQPCFEQVGAH